MEAEGSIFNTTNDSEVILHLIARSRQETVDRAAAEALRRVQGAFSVALINPRLVILARDPRGFRPLCLGRLDDAWVAASETCASASSPSSPSPPATALPDAVSESLIRLGRKTKDGTVVRV